MELHIYNTVVLVNYGAALQQLGDFIDAKQQEEKAISINPTDANAYINLGVDLFQLGFIDAAVENLLHAIEQWHRLRARQSARRPDPERKPPIHWSY